MRSYVTSTTMYVQWHMSFSHVHMCIGPSDAPICSKEALFAVELDHYSLELILEMACVQGGGIFFALVYFSHTLLALRSTWTSSWCVSCTYCGILCDVVH